MEKTEKEGCECDESENAETESSDYATYSTDMASSEQLSDLALMRRSGLTVEQIFAQEIYEWRKAQGANMPFNITVETQSGGGYAFDNANESETISAATNQPSLRPTKRRKYSLHAAKSTKSSKIMPNEVEAEGDGNAGKSKVRFARSDSLGYYEPGEKPSKTLNLRKEKSMSPTGSKEESERDEDAKYQRRMSTIGPIIRDIIRLMVVFFGSFFITYLPWLYVPLDVKPDHYKFNITRHNICFWLGSMGMLDDDNPCPYRAYLHITEAGKDCIRWSDVWENKTLVELIRKEAKKGEPNPKTNKAFFSTQAFEFMEKFKAKWPKDYTAPFCRRLGNKPSLIYPHCFVYEDESAKENHQLPVLQNCWVVPCSQATSNDCYKMYWRNKQAKKQNSKSP